MPKHQSLGGPSPRNEALEQAKFALDTGRPSDAERIAADLLKANAGNREAAKLLGYALIMQKRVDEAVAVLERAARGSHDAELETQLAIALQRVGRMDDALQSLSRAVKRKPPFPAAFFEFGPLLTSLQRYDEAIDVLKRGVAAAPMMPDMLVKLGDAYAAKNDRKDAADCYRRALALNPDHRAATNSLGLMMIHDRNFAAGADLFRALINADPANANARINLASCLLGLGQDDIAYACLRAANERGAQFYGRSLRVLVTSNRGRFWLRPSAAANFLKGKA
jgi:tetratricopeptide (TPR) repeat protein